MALLAQRHRDWGCLLVLPPATSNVYFGVRAWHPYSRALKMRTSSDRLQPERASLESCCSPSSAHCTARTEAQRLGLLASLPLQTSNLDRGSVPGVSGSPDLKMRTSADRSQPERPSLESCCSASSAHGTARTEAHCLGCLLLLPPQTSHVDLGVRAGGSGSPALETRTSADTSQPERSSLESCCSTSSAHGTARTEAQRLGLRACLPPQTSDLA